MDMTDIMKKIGNELTFDRTNFYTEDLM